MQYRYQGTFLFAFRIPLNDLLNLLDFLLRKLDHQFQILDLSADRQVLHFRWTLQIRNRQSEIYNSYASISPAIKFKLLIVIIASLIILPFVISSKAW